MGKFPYPPYYWWESGAAFGGMVEYWHYTGDVSYNNVTWQALVSQISPTNDFMPVKEQFDEVRSRDDRTIAARTDTAMGTREMTTRLFGPWLPCRRPSMAFLLPLRPIPHGLPSVKMYSPIFSVGGTSRPAMEG